MPRRKTSSASGTGHGRRQDGVGSLLPRQLRDRIAAAAKGAEARGMRVEVDVKPHGHGALITVSLDGAPALGPVAPELAEAFLRGVACGAESVRRGPSGRSSKGASPGNASELESSG